MTPYDQIKRAKNRGNANQDKSTATRTLKTNRNETRPKSKQSSKLVINRTSNVNKSNKPSYNDNQAYRSVRASASVVDMYQALQIVLGDKNRSDTMKKVLDIAMPKLLDTADKKAMFNKKLKGIKLVRTLK